MGWIWFMVCQLNNPSVVATVPENFLFAQIKVAAAPPSPLVHAALIVRANMNSCHTLLMDLAPLDAPPLSLMSCDSSNSVLHC